MALSTANLAFRDIFKLPGKQEIGDVIDSVQQEVQSLRKSWFMHLVASYLDWRPSRTTAVPAPGETIGAAARQVVRRACVRSAFTGAAAGALATSAAVATAETGALGGIVAIPAAALAVGGEMVLRALVHLEMTCELAELFHVPFDRERPEDLWRLYALAFHAHHASAERAGGRRLVQELLELEDSEIGERIGDKLLGESVLRNAVPFLSVASSSWENWRLTKRVGDTVRRSCRAERALRDALDREPALRSHDDLLLEGLWLVFAADGPLHVEEVATLASYLRRTGRRGPFDKSVGRDLESWLSRIPSVPEPARNAMLHVLHVGAAVSAKSVDPSVATLLQRTGTALGVPHDPERLTRLVDEAQGAGVMADP
jgi:hypothetical protein